MTSRITAYVSSMVLRPAIWIGSILMIVTFVAGFAWASAATAGPKIGGPFRLTDQNGQTVTDQDMKGHPFLIFFGFTNCADTCPATLSKISKVLASLGSDADHVGALFVTVDPRRDTPPKLKEFLSSFDSHIRGLTGSAAAIAAVTKAYKIYVKKVPFRGGYAVDHTAIVYLVDKQGKVVAPFDLERSPEDAAAELRRYL